MSNFFPPKTLARLCAESGSLDSLKCLVEHRCSTQFLIRAATKSNQISTLKYLLTLGLDVNESSPMVPPALFAAVTNRNLESAEMLLLGGADPSKPHKDHIPLSIAAKDNPPMAALLLKYGSPLSPLPPSTPPLALALRHQQNFVVSTLLLNGADPNSAMKSSQGETILPLEIAIGNHSPVTTTLLVMSGANVNFINKASADERILAQLEQYAMCPKIRSDMDFGMLSTDFSTLEGSLLSLFEDLKKPNGKQMTPAVNALRAQMERIAIFVPKLAAFSELLNGRRTQILKQIFGSLEKRDRELIVPSIQADGQSWSKFFPHISDLVKRNSVKGSKQQKMFADFCAKEIEAFGNKFCEEEKKMLGGDIEAGQTDKEQTEALLTLNETLRQFKNLLSSVYTRLDQFEKCEMDFFESSIGKLKSFCHTLGDLTKNDPIYSRAGLSEDQVRVIHESLNPKNEVIQGSLSQMEENYSKITEMTEILMKLVRMMAK